MIFLSWVRAQGTNRSCGELVLRALPGLIVALSRLDGQAW